MMSKVLDFLRKHALTIALALIPVIGYLFARRQQAAVVAEYERKLHNAHREAVARAQLRRETAQATAAVAAEAAKAKVEAAETKAEVLAAGPDELVERLNRRRARKTGGAK